MATDQPRPATPWAGYALAAAGAFLFASKGIIIKLAYAENVDTETLLALRMAISLPFFVVIGMLGGGLRGAPGAVTPMIVGRACLIGMLGYWFSSYADFSGLLYISAQFERLILFTYPLFVVLFGAAFFKQALNVRALSAFGVSYCGLALIFTQDFAAGGADVLKGVMWVMTAAVSYALYQLLAHDAIKVLGARLFTSIAMTAASIAALLHFAVTHGVTPPVLSERVLWLGAILAIAATVMPSFLMNAALQRISAQANATIATLSPVATIALAVIVLGEGLSVIDVAGSALVVAGVAWFTLASRRR